MINEHTRLHLLDYSIAALIRQASGQDLLLRSFAHDCAQFAIAVCGIECRILDDALQCLEKLAQGQHVEDEGLCKKVEKIAGRLDELAFDAQDAVEQGRMSFEEYTKAFRMARSATSVLSCFADSARSAAIDACYEACHATDDVSSILGIAQRSLVV